MTNAIFVSRCPVCFKRIHHSTLESWLNCPTCGNVQRVNAIASREGYKGELASLAEKPFAD